MRLEFNKHIYIHKIIFKRFKAMNNKSVNYNERPWCHTLKKKRRRSNSVLLTLPQRGTCSN